MHTQRAAWVLLLLLTASTAGCVENMGDLKVALGVTKPPPPPTVYDPPLAKAQVNATSALVGLPLRFASEGSNDAQGLPLTFTWRFGDGASANGATVTHAFANAGEYAVKLTVTNAKGLSDEAAVNVQILPANRAPDARIAVDPARGAIGDEVAFDAAGSTDPEGGALTYAWDFGDGATSHQARATHAFSEPGRHVVRLTVTDPAGNAASSTVVVPIDGAWTQQGKHDVGGPDAVAVPIVVAQGAASLTATLTYEAGLAGTNNATLRLKDATGDVVATSAPPAQPAGIESTRTTSLALSAADLASWSAGAWTVEVVRGGAPSAVAWTLVVSETF